VFGNSTRAAWRAQARRVAWMMTEISPADTPWGDVSQT
jgi:hypothetical protein